MTNLGVAHASHAALLADVGGDALQSHHRHRARLLRDARLLWCDHVHDHTTLQHLGQPHLRLAAERQAVKVVWAILWVTYNFGAGGPGGNMRLVNGHANMLQSML